MHLRKLRFQNPQEKDGNLIQIDLRIRSIIPMNQIGSKSPLPKYLSQLPLNESLFHLLLLRAVSRLKKSLHLLKNLNSFVGRVPFRQRVNRNLLSHQNLVLSVRVLPFLHHHLHLTMVNSSQHHRSLLHSLWKQRRSMLRRMARWDY